MFWYKVWKFSNFGLWLSYIRSCVMELKLLIFWNWIRYWLWTEFWLTCFIFGKAVWYSFEWVFGFTEFWGFLWVLSFRYFWFWFGVLCLLSVSGLMISNVTISLLLEFVDCASNNQICQMNNISLCKKYSN